MLPEDPITEDIDVYEPEPKNRTLLWVEIIGGILLLLGLLAAAYVGGRWMTGQTGATGGSPGGGSGPVLSIRAGPGGGGDAGAAPVSMQIQLLPAKELPQYQPTANGVFVERQDNRLFIGTGNVTVSVGPETGAKSSYSGPKVEVVVTEQTQVYRDVTQPDFENPSEAIQQEAEPSTIEAIPSQAAVSVWGRQVGDRIVADVVFFMSPIMIKAPGGQ